MSRSYALAPFRELQMCRVFHSHETITKGAPAQVPAKGIGPPRALLLPGGRDESLDETRAGECRSPPGAHPGDDRSQDVDTIAFRERGELSRGRILRDGLPCVRARD